MDDRLRETLRKSVEWYSREQDRRTQALVAALKAHAGTRNIPSAVDDEFANAERLAREVDGE